MSFDIQGNTGDWFTNQTPEIQTEYIKWIYNELNSRIVPMSFKKADDSLRTMNCTLKDQIINGDAGIPADVMESTAQNHVIAVWDTDISAWRSFRLDRLINVQ